MELPVIDRLARPIADLRISVTDRCNFRCTYCMPKEIFGPNYPFLDKGSILTFEEIERVARIAVTLGVAKVRLTGGEPLLRRQLETLVGMLARIGGLSDLTITTNGALLEKHAAGLKAAGLHRVSGKSLDSPNDATFQAMNDVGFPVAPVLAGIDAALAVGLPVKVNMVVQRGVNEADIVPMARHFLGTGCILRFIEYMDVGSTNGWRLTDVVPAAEIVAAIDREMPIEPIGPNYPGEVAKRYCYKDGSGEIGLVTSVTQPFCSGCTRARLSADGRMYTCLFAADGHDLRRHLRSGGTDTQIADVLQSIWIGRDDRYSELRTARTNDRPKVEMSRIGG